MNLRLAILCLLLLLSRTVVAEEKTVYRGAKGSVSIELDREDWSAIEPITGKLIFHVTEVVDKLGDKHIAVRLNGPKFNITLADDMQQVPVSVKWRTFFLPTIKVGHRYELQFSIRAEEAFEKLVKKEGESLALWKTGRFRVSATVDSPIRAPWDEPTKSQFIELYQQFTSESKEVTIGAAGGRVLSADNVKNALETADGPLKQQIVTFYAKRKVLGKKDLLAAIEGAKDKPKAEMAALYLSLNYPAGDLKFFTPVAEPVKLKGHPSSPLYLLVRPQQRVRFDFDVGEIHRFRVHDLDTYVTTKKQVDVDGPRAEGVYEMFDETHDKPWGWMLVFSDQDRIASAGLRPDTRELSAKVAEALFKQDAKALEALGAPGFRTSDVMKKVRFQLATGDIRYHESTGTTNKVQTRMKINIASEGKEPIFAKELWLDFVRVGEELKLTNAAVWDVEK